MLPFVTGERKRDTEQLRAARRLRLERRPTGACSSAAATASTTTASSCRFSRSSADSTAGRCRSRSAPATCSSSIRHRAAAAIRAHARQSVHRLHAARAPARRASTSSTRTCRIRWCTSSTSARAASSRRARPRRRASTTGHALPDRPHGRRGVQSRGRRTRSRGQHRVERPRPSTTRCSLSVGPSDSGRPQLPRRLHAGEGLQLCQRRSDPVPERTDRSERPAARVRADAERPPAPLRRVRHRRGCPAASTLAACGRCRPACRWTS